MRDDATYLMLIPKEELDADLVAGAVREGVLPDELDFAFAADAIGRASSLLEGTSDDSQTACWPRRQ